MDFKTNLSLEEQLAYEFAHAWRDENYRPGLQTIDWLRFAKILTHNRMAVLARQIFTRLNVSVPENAEKLIQEQTERYERSASKLGSALTATLLVSGCVVPVLTYFSWRRSRAAWAFLAALCGVFAVVGLFGAPKISRVLDLSLWTTMIFPGLYVVACATLALLRNDYVESATARRA